MSPSVPVRVLVAWAAACILLFVWVFWLYLTPPPSDAVMIASAVVVPIVTCTTPYAAWRAGRYGPWFIGAAFMLLALAAALLLVYLSVLSHWPTSDALFVFMMVAIVVSVASIIALFCELQRSPPAATDDAYQLLESAGARGALVFAQRA